jgi:pSer/pThr/pTyr-binding forkhead associated (FHA) protein
MGEKGPILVEGQKTITLGRIVFGEPSPTVDLTDYHGRLLGVSRHHAAIHFLDNGFSIEDLESSNGTWLNDNHLSPHQLTPLHDGDLIRLGQLVLLAHFQETGAATLREGEAEEKRKTPTRPLDAPADIRSLSLTLVGRPGRVEVRPDGVMTSLSYMPDRDALPEGAPTLFYTSRFYTVYIPTKLWKKVEAALNDPHDQLIVEGTCAYDTEIGRIAILATHVSTKHLEAVRARHLSRQNRRQDNLLKLSQKLRRS